MASEKTRTVAIPESTHKIILNVKRLMIKPDQKLPSLGETIKYIVDNWMIQNPSFFTEQGV